MTAGVVVLGLLNRSLVSGITDTARAKAQNVAAQLVAGGMAVGPVLTATPGEATALQVLDAAGQVVGASADLTGDPPILAASPPPGGEVVATVPLPLGQNNADYRVVAVRAHGYTVVAAQSLEAARAAITQLAVLLVITLVPLLAVAWLAVHLALRAALRPVEVMRRTVADISTADLTARVPLPPAQDEIHRLATTLNAMLGRLSSAQMAQRRFVADAGHELRSPLSTVTATLDLAARHPEQTSLAEVVDTAGAELGRLRELVDDLLVLARTDDSSDMPPITDVDLDDVIRAEAARLRSTTRMAVDVRAQPARTRGSPAQVARAVRNLVDNAAEHAEAAVSLSCRREDECVAVVEILDDGPGVPAADRVRIFGRFVRLEAERPRHAGSTGLGLAIVAGIAARHGGKAACVEPPRGHRGACFRLTFPAVSAGPVGGALPRYASVPRGQPEHGR
ncbi:sensor histidine kinase [Amycolatopsis nalaikhensis]|uniref:histidine kinase n=1 Tax=Amycolatopsis nalaikhensis TaxID=715472 RepID=A0ABY8XUD8_9PSEU|nr:ATP-binding protein [Amycolatopsis sp. 2-2]WIV59191.1 ATP-binding protein [Amycolatopsis sp. 2-2]